MNIEEYCKNMQQCFSSEVVIKVTKPPKYISDLNITNQKDSIIFIYKEEVKQEQQSYQNETGLINGIGIEESLADLSLTGQPLECPFEKDSDDALNIISMIKPVVFTEDHYYAPVTLMEARKCISFVNLEMHPPHPVWILTDSADKRRTFLMGCEIKSKWNTRMWAMAHSNQTEKIPIPHLIEDFERTFNVTAGYKRTSAVSCVFNIKDKTEMARNSKCFFEVNWQQPSYEVPVAQADTFLIIECNVGQEECQVSRWWQQLILMHKYLEIIKQRKQSCQLQMTYERDSIELPSFKSERRGELPLASRVQKLLKVSDSMSVCRQLNSQQDTSALNATIQHLLTDNLQKGQDVTDRLWNLLIEAETYQDLAESFQLVIREVRKQPVKPYIFAKNKTRLACLLRNIKTSPDVELMLEPLELMVEMGLEKLKRDYIFIFLSSQLASVDSLSLPKLPSFSEVGSGEWQSTVEAQMQWLAQVHTVLELVSVIHSSLSVPTLVQVTAQALSTFVRPAKSPVPSLLHLINNRTYQLRAPVLTKEVRSFVEGDRTFYKWMLKLSADSDSFGFSSTFILFKDSPFPDQILNQLQVDDTLNDTGNILDFRWQTTEMNNCDSNVQEMIHFDSQLQEKYTYIQLCSASNKCPY